MNTVQKFEYLRTETFNGQDYLKRHFLSATPIVYTTDLNDRSILKKYANMHDQVWLVSPTVQLNPNFPWWLRISDDAKNVEYEFPYVHKNSKNIKSWGLVKLVPTCGEITETVRKRNICGYYDAFNGKSKFDIFFLGDPASELYAKLKSINESVTAVPTIKEAFGLTTTDMFWIVPANIKLADDFKFDTMPSEKSYDYPQVFAHGKIDETDGGIVLMPKSYEPSEKEIEHSFYIKRRIIKQIASYPA